MDTQMWVITHKNYPGVSDDLYRTLHVGRALSQDLGYTGDDTGDNISLKNRNYCELTGLYWLWKNNQCDIIGVCHYRRFFLEKGRMLTKEYIEKTLNDYDIIVPTCGMVKEENVRKQYAANHYEEDFDICRDVISEKYPEYVEAFDIMAESKLLNFCNMIITRKNIFDDYCKWLFDVLFEVEKRVDISDRDDYQKRIFGFLSERLIKVWLIKNEYKVKEQNVKMMDSDELDKKSSLNNAIRNVYQKITAGILKKYLSPTSLPEKINQSVCSDGRIPVWTYWWDGEEQSPEAVKKCIKSIRDNIDSNKYKLHVITLADCQQYVTFSNIIIDKVNSGKMPLNILAHRLSMELLYRYGGVWISPECFVADERVNDFIDSGEFVSLKHEGICDKSFLKGPAGFPLFGFVMESIDTYFSFKDDLLSQDMTDEFINIACEHMDYVRNDVDKCPDNNKNCEFFKENADRVYREEIWDDVVKDTWLYKLQSDRQYKQKNIIDKDTFYRKIICR